ncbi:MAG TPA: pentapeptide repeat-containing protein [Thermosynechococcaceae cyanobacterium]
MAISKTWRSPFLLGATVLIGLLVLLWSVQQSNVSTLARRLRGLKQQIRALPEAVDQKQQLDQQLTQLKQQIDTLPVTQSEPFNQGLATLRQQVNLLPDSPAKDQLEQRTARLQEQAADSSLVPRKEQLNQQLVAVRQQVNDLAERVSQKERLTIEKDRLTIEQDQVTLQNAVYGSLIQALVGLFFFTTAYFTWRHVQAIEEEQIIERFGKAVEQLGNPSAEVRLAGIYGLERVARDSEKDNWTIMELFASFVQSKSPRSSALNPAALETELDEPLPDVSPLPNDVQAVLKVMGRRDTSRDPDNQQIVLDRTNLSQTTFKGFCFRGVSFKQADLSRSNLREADLREADLREADLRGAYLGLVNCRNAVLTAALLHRAELIGAVFRDADLAKADLTDADLRGVDLRGANLHGANLHGANLKGADLRGVRQLTPEQIETALIAENTQLPEHLRSLQPTIEPPPADG